MKPSTIKEFRLLKRFRVPALLALALAAPQLALAHAVLVDSTPKLNGVVAGTALHIHLRFNSRVDGPRCTLSLATAGGPTQTLRLVAQPAPDSIAAEATGLHQGAYTLRWQALASDGHITRGEIPFRVEPAAPKHMGR